MQFLNPFHHLFQLSKYQINSHSVNHFLLFSLFLFILILVILLLLYWILCWFLIFKAWMIYPDLTGNIISLHCRVYLKVWFFKHCLRYFWYRASWTHRNPFTTLLSKETRRISYMLTCYMLTYTYSKI